MSTKNLDVVLVKLGEDYYVHDTHIAHGSQVESDMEPLTNCSPRNLIETPFIGHTYTVSCQLLLQSQASEPLAQILDLFDIACLVKLLACLL
jgi:hypothetical protein